MADANQTPSDRPDAEPAPSSSPWHQPIVWLMLLLVAAAVGGGLAIVIIAGGDGAIDTVAADVRRTAQVQTADLSPDALAHALDLSAVLRIDGETRRVHVLPVTGRFDRTAPLELVLRHPTRAASDLHVPLQPDDLGWRAQVHPGDDHDWLVELGPRDRRWRLQGRLERGTLATHLRPAVAAP